MKTGTLVALLKQTGLTEAICRVFAAGLQDSQATPEMKPRNAAPSFPSSFPGLAPLRFPADLERAFQKDGYDAYRQPLRYVCAFVALIYLSLFLRNYTFGTDTHFLAD